MNGGKKRDFLTLADVPTEAWPDLWKRAAVLKESRARGERMRTLAGKSIALVFEKASTRTRVSFEVGVFELGGHAVVISQQGSQLGRGEPIEDTARVLSGYCHAIVLRTFGQERVATLQKFASVPVVNGLSDQHHPCQVATEARGRGLLRGVAITGSAPNVVAKCREKGVLLSVAGANVVRFAPPYVIDRAQIDEAIAALDAVLGATP